MLMWNYFRFDFGQSYFRDTSVLKLIGERLPVSISLGLWMTLHLLRHLDSARHSQGRAGRLALRRVDQHGDRHRLCHSGLPVRRVPHRAVRRRLVLATSSRCAGWRRRIGRSSPGHDKILDYFWHMVLPMIAMSLSAFATLTFLTKNSFLEEIRKQYVMTARAKGLTEHQVLYGHVFRNAMLIIIAGFPGAFISAFFAGSLLIETIFSLGGPRAARLRIGDEPRLSGGVRHRLHLLADGPRHQSHLRPHLYLGRSAHRFRDARGLVDGCPHRRRNHREATAAGLPERRFVLSVLNERRWQTFKAHKRGYWSLWIFLILFVISLFAEFIANDKPLLVKYRRPVLFPGVQGLSGDRLRRHLRDRGRLSRPGGQGDDRRQERLDPLAADPLLLRHAEQESANGLSGEANLDADQGGLRGGDQGRLSPLQ